MKLLGLLLVAAWTLMGSETPELTFTVPGSGAIQIRELRGKVAVIAFGYTTCVPCQVVAERMSKLANEYRDRGVQFFSVSFDPNAASLIERSEASKNRTVAMGWASGESVLDFLGYGAADRPSVPQLVVLDRDGNIRYKTAAQGSDDLRGDATLRVRIAELLASTGSSGSASPQPAQKTKQ